MANRTCYGYDVRPDGELAINEAEAIVVHWIFDCYLTGDSLGRIASGLKKQGVLSPAGKATWNREALSKLLSNEKYTGAVLLQNTVTICGVQFQNDGEQARGLVKAITRLSSLPRILRKRSI